MIYPSANITTYSWHSNNFPLGFCRKDDLPKPEFQHNTTKPQVESVCMQDGIYWATWTHQMGHILGHNT